MEMSKEGVEAEKKVLDEKAKKKLLKEEKKAVAAEQREMDNLIAIDQKNALYLLDGEDENEAIRRREIEMT